MKRKLVARAVFIHLVGVFVFFGLIFWWANQSSIVWAVIVLMATIVAVTGAFFFVSNNPLHLLYIALIFIEITTLFQYWEARSRNKAAIAMCIYWFVIHLIDAPAVKSEYRRRVIVLGLIFIFLYAMVVLTLPPEFQF